MKRSHNFPAPVAKRRMRKACDPRDEITAREILCLVKSLEAEKERLRFEQQERESELKRLRTENSDLRSANDDLKLKLDPFKRNQREANDEVTRLRTENEELLTENVDLRTEVGDLSRELQPFLRKQRQSKMSKLGRPSRLKKFPWLSRAVHNVRKNKRAAMKEEIQQEEPPSIRDLPHDVWSHLAKFLDDDTRFEMRGLNSSFYNAYYDTRTTYKSRNQVNAKRALALTTMGRVFRNVTHLKLNGGRLHLGQLQGFPRLASIESRDQKFELIPAFAGPELGPRKTVTRLAVPAKDVKHATVANFPNLRFLLITYFEGRIEFSPHPKLEEIRADDPGENYFYQDDLEQINREAFPSLRRIVVDKSDQTAARGFVYDKAAVEGHVARLEAEGIDVIFEERE